MRSRQSLRLDPTRSQTSLVMRSRNRLRRNTPSGQTSLVMRSRQSLRLNPTRSQTSLVMRSRNRLGAIPRAARPASSCEAARACVSIPREARPASSCEAASLAVIPRGRRSSWSQPLGDDARPARPASSCPADTAVTLADDDGPPPSCIGIPEAADAPIAAAAATVMIIAVSRSPCPSKSGSSKARSSSSRSNENVMASASLSSRSDARSARSHITVTVRVSASTPACAGRITSRKSSVGRSEPQCLLDVAAGDRRRHGIRNCGEHVARPDKLGRCACRLHEAPSVWAPGLGTPIRLLDEDAGRHLPTIVPSITKSWSHLKHAIPKVVAGTRQLTGKGQSVASAAEPSAASTTPRQHDPHHPHERTALEIGATHGSGERAMRRQRPRTRRTNEARLDRPSELACPVHCLANPTSLPAAVPIGRSVGNKESTSPRLSRSRNAGSR